MEYNRSDLFNSWIKREPPNYVYHYTNPLGLIGIIESKKIWASNIRFLNDINEVVEATNIAKRIIKDRIEEYNQTEVADFLKSVFGLLSELKSYTYVCSFSEEDDSLSQWRAYCPPTGGGYALGVPGLVMKENAFEKEWLFVKCIYNDEYKYKIMEQVIDSYIIDCKQLNINRVEEESKNLVLRDKETLSIDFLLEVLEIGAALKNEAFEVENEWRLIKPRLTSSEMIKFRGGKSGVIPYCEYELLCGEHPICLDSLEVVIGPTPQAEAESNLAAEYLLKGNVKNISSTRVPYKGW